MGNKQSSPNVQSTLTQANFHPEVEVLEKSHHDPHYGEVKVVRDVKNATKYVLKEVVHHTNKSFDSDHAFFSKRVTVKHPNVIDIVGFNTLSQSNLCANHFKITLFIEHVDRNLKADLDIRRNANEAYSDNEILSIADDIISGLAYFQQQNISHGDIRPLNIFVKNGTCKLSDPSLSAERGFTALIKSILSGTKTLPSPLILSQIGAHKFESAGNPFKNDVFSLGATLLSLSTLTNSEDFYDYKKGKLDEVLIEQRLHIVQRTRPNSILDLVRDMLTLNESTRPDPLALQTRVHSLRSGEQGRIPMQVPTQVPVYTPSVEPVRRSIVVSPPPVISTTVVGADDLEARIRAALERSEATFRAVNASSVRVEPTHTSNIALSSYVPSSSYTMPVTTTVGELKKSATNINIGTTSYATELRKSSGLGLGLTGTEGISTANYTYVPSSTYTTVGLTGNEGLVGSGAGYSTANYTYVPSTNLTTVGITGSEGLKRSGVGLSTGVSNITYVPSTNFTTVGITGTEGVSTWPATVGLTTTGLTSNNYVTELRKSGGLGLTSGLGYTTTLGTSGVGLTTSGLGYTTGLGTSGVGLSASGLNNYIPGAGYGGVTSDIHATTNAGYTSGGYSTYDTSVQDAIKSVVDGASGLGHFTSGATA